MASRQSRTPAGNDHISAAGLQHYHLVGRAHGSKHFLAELCNDAEDIHRDDAKELAHPNGYFHNVGHGWYHRGKRPMAGEIRSETVVANPRAGQGQIVVAIDYAETGRCKFRQIEQAIKDVLKTPGLLVWQETMEIYSMSCTTPALPPAPKTPSSRKRAALEDQYPTPDSSSKKTA
ncbi:hypothetical protein LTR56_008825 [Elasticomyces elasticus]|nr:hypothetical protein LTR22_021726 [Elasticomyces elasticus]KAK3645947.1 hypothetical protein LTR56_008825 [Elasticomyces elasticus]KAK4928101.1 hypothetical protein LTR49_005039 [Elasticomyces elasticus]KAK5765854.1 hypothetical protein LTS12_003861 [Elasticomyces elasticus]